MPSPIGHALAGVAVAWTADLVDGRRSSPRLLTLCAGLAMLPDIDLLVPDAHRTATHSVTAAAIVFIIAAVVTGKVTRQAVLCGTAYASHLLLDWLGADNFPPRGLQVFWPFSRHWYISDLDLFRQTARQHFFTPPIIRRNTIAVAQEIAILAPIVVVLWLVRIKTAARFSAEVSRSDHPAQ
jgi:inner membrane protein